MKRAKIDTKAIGLDVGLGFIRWLTGAENLHYGLWTGLEPTAENLGKAQIAYTDKLFGYLPEGKLSILDVGGGAGETAKKLIALGHALDIVVPSALFAERCRENAPEATVHEITFEEFGSEKRFDLVLFSESFQYIPLDIALDKALDHVKPGGHVLVSDCFRSDNFAPDGKTRIVGGGHLARDFAAAIENRAVEVIAEEDVTQAVAPSIDIERGLFNVLGDALRLVDAELSEKKPKARWFLDRTLKLVFGKRKSARLNARLRGDDRTSAVFAHNNRYLMTLVKKI